jgi:hypothetical protein
MKAFFKLNFSVDVGEQLDGVLTPVNMKEIIKARENGSHPTLSDLRSAVEANTIIGDGEKSKLLRQPIGGF